MKLASAALFLLLSFSFAFAQNEQSPITEKDFAYKDWTYKAIKGDSKTNLREFTKGKKLVLVVYWAPWCHNWEHDMEFVKGLNDKYKDKGLAIIGVGEYDTVDKMRDHVEKNKLAFSLV
ncbi:MAG TPA: redoxin domain-containing protein, partial [Pyrinomonadaceae bacterium]|nr:redoxin domain-containing protein [Pyrinomonadaceae bacterium]